MVDEELISLPKQKEDVLKDGAGQEEKGEIESPADELTKKGKKLKYNFPGRETKNGRSDAGSDQQCPQLLVSDILG